MFLMETSLVKEKGKKVWVKYGCSEGWEVPRESFSGGLLLAWMLKQRLKVVYESKNLVHTDLLNNKGNPCPLPLYMVTLNFPIKKLYGKNLEV